MQRFDYNVFSVDPARINIENKNGELVVGTNYLVICRSFGSRPSAQITWYLDYIKIGQFV